MLTVPTLFGHELAGTVAEVGKGVWAFTAGEDVVVANSSSCGSCDNCLHPKTQMEAQEEVQLLLEAVIAVKEKFAADHVVNVLTGKEDKIIKDYQHNGLEVFGEGADKDAKFWTAVIRQTLLAGLLAKDIDNYGLLKITPSGKDFLKNPASFMVTQDHDFDDTEASDDDEPSGSGGGGSAADAELFAMLKDLCKKVAKQKNVPPFVVFQETSLEEMAIQYPITMDELKNISGVGPGKAVKFGKPFIDLISRYVEENEIDRPMDLVVKSVVNKSGLKVYIIQNIDRKLSLDVCGSMPGSQRHEFFLPKS
jgi:ATP-dependent DNA helicase RecQ